MAKQSKSENSSDDSDFGKDLEVALRTEMRRSRKLLNQSKELEVKLTECQREAEVAQSTILAYSAEMNKLAVKINELAALMGDSFTQCTMERYERMQHVLHSLRARIALDIGVAGPFGVQDQLSRQENRVYSLVEQGLTSQEIADKLSLSVHTVDTHRRSIRRKLKAQRNR